MTQPPIPFLDLRAQYRSIQKELEAALLPVLESCGYILGPEVQALETEVASYTGAAHAVAVASGTDAILLALMALDIGPGDEVLTSAYSFFATAGAIVRTGARPVFVDIDPRSYNIDADATAKRLTSRTRAIMPVHLYGQCADMEPLEALANGAGIPIIEDAAQAIGARARDRGAGSMGLFGCLSFYPTKNLGGIGDGGMVLTSDPALAERLRVLRNHGQTRPYEHPFVGLNSRLDAVNGAALRVKLRHLDEWTAKRRDRAEEYRRLFLESGLAPERVGLPEELPGQYHVYNQFVVRVRDRDALRSALQADGIGSMVYYPRPLPDQPSLEDFTEAGAVFPASTAAALETLALPMYPELTSNQQRGVVEAVARHICR